LVLVMVAIHPAKSDDDLGHNGGSRHKDRLPRMSEAANRTMNTTNRTHAISEASHATGETPRTPATRARIRNIKARRNMACSFQSGIQYWRGSRATKNRRNIDAD